MLHLFLEIGEAIMLNPFEGNELRVILHAHTSLLNGLLDLPIEKIKF